MRIAMIAFGIGGAFYVDVWSLTEDDTKSLEHAPTGVAPIPQGLGGTGHPGNRTPNL